MLYTLCVMVVILTVVVLLLWRKLGQQQQATDLESNPQIEQKVLHLESHLKQTLEILQGLVKKMHVQQDNLDKTMARTQQLELQNAELVSLLAKTVEVQIQQNH